MSPTWAELTVTFWRIGWLSFGGPAAQISLMHRALVVERKWLTEQQYLNALGFCMLLPGPEAMQLCTYAGWRLRGIPGGLIAGLLFVLPGAAVIFALAALYTTYVDLPMVQIAFLGIKAAVLIIVIEALLKVSKRALNTTAHWVIAGLAFVGIYLLDLPFPLIIAAAALYGFATTQTVQTQTPAITTSLGHTVLTIAVGLTLWLLPVVMLPAGLLSDVGQFFSWLAVVTFGGAYAVLTYMQQAVVADFNWISPDEMVDGLGLAETTPGPLILVTQFVAYLTGYNAGGAGTGIRAALITLWVTFVPCFLWIFAGAPYLDRISANPRLSGALQAITAAVVGVILNLAIYFGFQVLFGSVARIETGPLAFWWPEFGSYNLPVLVLTGLAAVLLLVRHASLGLTLIACALASLALDFVF